MIKEFCKIATNLYCYMTVKFPIFLKQKFINQKGRDEF
jgi:hypothetical protein